MFIPYKDSRTHQLWPATTALILINVLIHATLVATGGHLHAIARFGLVGGVYDPITFVTSAFLHAGWLHLIGNMLFLWIAGPSVEERVGTGRFLGFYLLGGIVAALAQLLWSGLPIGVPMIGASGAVSAVVGAYGFLASGHEISVFWMLFFRGGVFQIRAGWGIALWFLGQLGRTVLTPHANVAHAAHAGGAIYGAVVAYLLFRYGAVGRIDLLGREEHYGVSTRSNAAAAWDRELARQRGERDHERRWPSDERDHERRWERRGTRGRSGYGRSAAPR